MQKDTKTQTIAEFIEANGGLEKLNGREVTNGKYRWVIASYLETGRVDLRRFPKASGEDLYFTLYQAKNVGIPGLRLAPRQVSVHQYAVKAKGRHAEVSAKHFTSKEEAVKYYESLTSPGSVEWAQKLRHTEETRTEPEETPDAKDSED
jgi:hypothetical protein